MVEFLKSLTTGLLKMPGKNRGALIAVIGVGALGASIYYSKRWTRNEKDESLRAPESEVRLEVILRVGLVMVPP